MIQSIQLCPYNALRGTLWSNGVSVDGSLVDTARRSETDRKRGTSTNRPTMEVCIRPHRQFGIYPPTRAIYGVVWRIDIYFIFKDCMTHRAEKTLNYIEHKMNIKWRKNFAGKLFSFKGLHSGTAEKQLNRVACTVDVRRMSTVVTAH